MTKHSIDYIRLVALPMIIIAFLTSAAGYLVVRATLGSFKELNDTNGLAHAAHVATHISEEMREADRLETLIEDQLLEIAQVVIANRSQLSNAYLATLVDVTSADYIYWYDDTGTILYDASDIYVGWQVSTGDPIDTFMKSGLYEHSDPIRQSITEPVWYKYVYARDDDDYFVQIGITADELYDQLFVHSYVSDIEGFVDENEQILYGLFLDTTYTAIFDTDEEDEGLNYADDPIYQRVMAGESLIDKWYYPQNEAFVDEIAVPVYFEDEIIGILALGYSLEYYETIENYIVFVFAFFAMFIFGVYLFMQGYQILTPISRLADQLDAIDMESDQPQEFPRSRGPLMELHESLGRLATKIHAENAKTHALTREFKRFAFTDFLTKLPNRLAFHQHVDGLIKKQEPFIVIFIDLDGFKAYNDTQGHTFGDLLLTTLAKQFSQLVTDEVYFGRFGGDEFVGTCQVHDEAQVRDFLKKLRQAIMTPLLVENQPYFLDASIGVSHFPRDGAAVDDLIRKADMAMYHSKSKRKTQVSIYRSEMGWMVSKEAEIVHILKMAIANESFDVVYQPQLRVDNHLVTSFEALIRLTSENIKPHLFIPIAEKHGMMHAITRLVFCKVIEQLSLWSSQHLRLVPVYINLSSQDFEDDTLLDDVCALIKKHHVSADMIGIELTESSLIHNEESAKTLIRKWQTKGFHTALDDFGSGQAGINYLSNYKMDKVKLDKAFADRYLNPEGLAVFTHVVQLAQLLRFEVLAEGIETQAQLELLQQTGCLGVQGDYFYKPLSVHDLSNILQTKD